MNQLKLKPEVPNQAAALSTISSVRPTACPANRHFGRKLPVPLRAPMITARRLRKTLRCRRQVARRCNMMRCLALLCLQGHHHSQRCTLWTRQGAWIKGPAVASPFRSVAICAKVSLFGGDSEAPPLSSFAAGYCATRGILRKVLISLLTELGASQVRSVCSAHMPRRLPPARSQPARGHERGRSARARGT